MPVVHGHPLAFAGARVEKVGGFDGAEEGLGGGYAAAVDEDDLRLGGGVSVGVVVVLGVDRRAGMAGASDRTVCVGMTGRGDVAGTGSRCR